MMIKCPFCNEELRVAFAVAANMATAAHEAKEKLSAEAHEAKEKLSAEAIPIEELNLSAIPRNILARREITTVGQLTRYSFAELSRFKYLGRKSVNEIERALAARGVRLRGSAADGLPG